MQPIIKRLVFTALPPYTYCEPLLPRPHFPSFQTSLLPAPTMSCVTSSAVDETSGKEGNATADGGVAAQPLMAFSSTSPAQHSALGGRVSVTSATAPYNGSAVRPPFSPSPPQEPPGQYYTAHYTYQAQTAEDLSFEKGESLLVLGSTDGNWWHAKSLKSQCKGYIPRNYVAPASTYEAEE